MSGSTSFSARTRNAGNIDAEVKIYGSFRSLNKFDPTLIQRSRHDDIFNNTIENFEIQPVRDAESRTEKNGDNPEKGDEKKERKKSRRHRDETNGSKHRSERRRSKSRNKGENSDVDTDGSRHKESRKKTSEKDIFDSIEQRRKERLKRREQDENLEDSVNKESNKENRRHRREEREKENIKNENSLLPPKPTSRPSKKPSENEESQQNNDTDMKPKMKIERSNSLCVKMNAFEEVKADSGSDNEAEVKVDIDKAKSRGSVDYQSATVQSIDLDHEYFDSLKKRSIVDFLLTPAPQGQTVNCRIICRRGIFNEYYFYLENFNKSDLLLVKAHRRVASTKSYYIMDAMGYDENGHLSHVDTPVGRIVSNMSRKKFKLDLFNDLILKSELLGIAFKTNVGEPRKIIANACLCSPSKDNNLKVTYFLKNKQPYFDLQRKKFVLNYNGRAKKSSKNNFQIVEESNPDEIIMQLGKVDTNIYNCDFSFPICALQALGFGLSSLCR